MTQATATSTGRSVYVSQPPIDWEIISHFGSFVWEGTVYQVFVARNRAGRLGYCVDGRANPTPHGCYFTDRAVCNCAAGKTCRHMLGLSLLVAEVEEAPALYAPRALRSFVGQQRPDVTRVDIKIAAVAELFPTAPTVSSNDTRRASLAKAAAWTDADIDQLVAEEAAGESDPYFIPAEARQRHQRTREWAGQQLA